MPHSPRFVDMAGQKFGYLTVKRLVGKNKHRMAMWECECECGKLATLSRNALITGNTSSCGCKWADANTTHGHKKKGTGKHRGTKTYKCWQQMKHRCTNPKNPHWKDYGGRGITVCQRWLESFENFLQDMGEAPEGMTIERSNNHLGYSKENCRWVSNDVQQRNRRNNVRITIGDETKCAAEWARIAGLPSRVIRSRFRAGWPASQLLMPINF